MGQDFKTGKLNIGQEPSYMGHALREIPIIDLAIKHANLKLNSRVWSPCFILFLWKLIGKAFYLSVFPSFISALLNINESRFA